MASDSETAEAPSTEGDNEKKKLDLTVKVEQPSACERHVAVTISREDIDRYLDDAISDMMPEAQVPGFRKGRAPRKLVESQFRRQVSDQVKGSILMDAMTQVNEEQEFSAISEPDFDFEAVELPDEGSLTFEFNLEVRPEFDLPEWKGLQLEKSVRDFTRDDVTIRLQEVLASHGTLASLDGEAQKGDYLTLNAVFKKDGEELSRLTEEVVRLRPVLSFHDAKFEDFGKLMEGVTSGATKTATFALGQECEKEELRGAEIEAEFEVVEVKRLELPEMDADFLEKIGGFESEDELRELVRQEMERQLTYRQQQQLRRQITEILTQDAAWELPPHMLRKQAQRELDRAVMEMQSSGFTPEEIQTYENDLRQNSEKNTARALKEHFILEKIAEEHGLDASPEDYDEEIHLIARQKRQSMRQVRARYDKLGLMDTLRNQIIERKAIALIEAEATFVESPLETDAQQDVAVNHAVGGPAEVENEIPDAKHGEEAKPLRAAADRS